jgi:hypothetical protein
MDWIYGWGLVYGIYDWISTLVMGDLMGRRFWVGCGFKKKNCLGGRGRGRGTPGHVLLSRFKTRFTGRHESPNSPFYVIYYILISGRHPDDLFHTLKTVKGILNLVPTRTPLAVGMMSYTHSVYVTCYFCYMFSLGPSSGSSVSVRVGLRTQFCTLLEV